VTRVSSAAGAAAAEAAATGRHLRRPADIIASGEVASYNLYPAPRNGALPARVVGGGRYVINDANFRNWLASRKTRGA